MRICALAIVLAVVPASAAGAAVPVVHAHRGGPERLMQPAFAEESMPAFRDAWQQRGAVLELDVKLSKDRVPVVIHDDTLDRTTACTGRVDARTWAELRDSCPSDVIGIDPHKTAKAAPGIPMTSLRELLDYARSAGATLNLEIKNIPGEKDFDPTSAFAETVVDTIKASGLPAHQLIVQSFWPANLDVVKQELPGVQTSFLTSAGEGGSEYAASRGYEWWSPSWPVTKQQVDQAHALGIKVVPWTVDTPDAVRAVAAAGAEAVITNDPVMARQALGLPLELAAPVAPVPAAPALRTPRRLRACGSAPGAARILVNARTGSCRTGRAVVRRFLRRGCPRAWRCTGSRRMRLTHRGGLVRFERA